MTDSRRIKTHRIFGSHGIRLLPYCLLLLVFFPSRQNVECFFHHHHNHHRSFIHPKIHRITQHRKPIPPYPAVPAPSSITTMDEAAVAEDDELGTISTVTPTSVSIFLQRIQTYLEAMYSQSSVIKCPFWRRRIADMIDSTAMILNFLVARHKSLDFLSSSSSSSSSSPSSHTIPPGCQAIGKHVMMNADGTVCKYKNLDIQTLCHVIQTDWCPTISKSNSNHTSNTWTGPIERNPIYKGYYITGKLNSTIYRDDCLFDGPDPDMPVRGLRKYLSAASHLFDHKVSYAKLHSIQVIHEDDVKQDDDIKLKKKNPHKIKATWELGGVLMLPWRPKIQSWTGSTIYHLDDERLVYLHEEKWDISVYEAFITTISPTLGEWIWGHERKRIAQI